MGLSPQGTPYETGTGAQAALEALTEAAILLEEAARLYHGIHRAYAGNVVSEIASVALHLARLFDVQEQRVRQSPPLSLLRLHDLKEGRRVRP